MVCECLLLVSILPAFLRVAAWIEHTCHESPGSCGWRFLKQTFIADLLGTKHGFYEVTSSWPQKLGPKGSVVDYL